MLTSLVFLWQTKKLKKLTKIVEVEEVKIHIFWGTCWNSMKFLRKMQLMLILKTKLYILFRQYIFWNIFWKLRRRFFFNKTSILFFAELAIFHYIQIKTSLGKIVKKITREKIWRLIYAFWYLPTYFTYAKILTYVRDHLRRFYGNCRTLIICELCLKLT